jgi:transaldolase
MSAQSSSTRRGSLRVKLFADGADLAGLRAAAQDPRIRGFTTNPTLMRQAGVDDYEAFAHAAIEAIGERPISFEVFSDSFDEMAEQARTIAKWGPNVYVKVPITDTSGEPALDLVRSLSAEGVQLNVTALLTIRQVAEVVDALSPGVPAFVSLFAGRIADTGRDPVPAVRAAVEIVHIRPGTELIWASPREVLNAVQASDAGCDIITMTSDLLKKLDLLGLDLDEYSLETVRMFRRDAIAAGYDL